MNVLASGKDVQSHTPAYACVLYRERAGRRLLARSRRFVSAIFPR